MVTKTNKKDYLKKLDWFKRHWILSIILGIILVPFLIGFLRGLFGGDNSDITGDIVKEQIKESCISDWSCDSWSECGTSEIQRRVCTDMNNCEISENKPSETQICEYEIKEDKKVKSFEEDYSFSDWMDDLGEVMEDLEETTNIYRKIDECTELCAGEDIDIPYIKNICHSDCYQIYYYAGEEALDKYIKELRNE